MAKKNIKFRRRRASRRALFEELESRLLLVSDWQNLDNRFDVDRSGVGEALDAALVISEIRSQGQGPLAPNDNPPLLPDVNGNFQLEVLDALELISFLRRGVTPVSIASADLANDTAPGGSTNSDGITSDATITGGLSDAGATGALKAQVDGGSFVNVSFDSNGNFTFDPGFPSDGSADGPHTIALAATDGSGAITSTRDVAFTLDTVAAVPAMLRLTQGTDTGKSDSDSVTMNTSPTVTGDAEPGSLVRLFVDGNEVGQTTANSPWQIATGPLARIIHENRMR